MNARPPINLQPASQLALNRRDLLKLVGGGLVFGIFVPEVSGAVAKLPSAYVRIEADGTVTLLSSKVEYGQGVMTSLAQMAAEELDVPLSSMRAVMGDTGQCPVDSDGGTYGSLTTRNFGPPLRTAAAQAKALLIQLASTQLGVPVDQLMTQDGFVISRNDPQVRISYATLAGGKSVTADLSTTPKTKDYTQFTVSGKSPVRLDAVEKVTGQAKYTADLQLPGMLYARILRPPARGATLTTVDTSAAEAIAGVRVARVSSLIAVLHEKPDVADQALKLVKAEYSLPQTGPDDTNIHQQLLSRPPGAATIGQAGSLTTGEKLAVTRIEQTYYTPYVAHAPIEPHAAVALFEGSKLTVWASTQTPFALRSDLASALGISSANIRVIPPCIGGAFGGKIYNQQGIEAARLAREVGKPVNLAWTRAEEFFYDNFQVPSIVKIRSGLDQNSKITFWDYQVYFVENRGTTVFYSIPHYRLQSLGNMTDSRLPFGGGAWRAPGSNANTFAREAHINSLASAARMDPVEFRLLNLKDTRMRKVLQSAAAAFGWQFAKMPSGRGFGVACGEDAGAYTVMMAQVEVDRKTGGIKVNRILCAQDLGRVINPDGVRTQMEGSMMMGLGYSLTEELHFKMGAITDLTFTRYRLPRFSWMPKLETVLIENNALTPQGVGESSIITVGAVLAGAVFDAIRVQPNQLPLTPARVLALIQTAPLLLDPPQHVGDQIQLSWNGGPGIRVQKSAALTNPTWQDVPNTEGQSRATLPAADATAYFRLVRP
jgi:nicotinate dehydrogenase subunit B